MSLEDPLRTNTSKTQPENPQLELNPQDRTSLQPESASSERRVSDIGTEMFGKMNWCFPTTNLKRGWKQFTHFFDQIGIRISTFFGNLFPASTLSKDIEMSILSSPLVVPKPKKNKKVDKVSAGNRIEIDLSQKLLSKKVESEISENFLTEEEGFIPYIGPESTDSELMDHEIATNFIDYLKSMLSQLKKDSPLIKEDNSDEFLAKEVENSKEIMKHLQLSSGNELTALQLIKELDMLLELKKISNQKELINQKELSNQKEQPNQKTASNQKNSNVHEDLVLDDTFSIQSPMEIEINQALGELRESLRWLSNPKIDHVNEMITLVDIASKVEKMESWFQSLEHRLDSATSHELALFDQLGLILEAKGLIEGKVKANKNKLQQFADDSSLDSSFRDIQDLCQMYIHTYGDFKEEMKTPERPVKILNIAPVLSRQSSVKTLTLEKPTPITNSGAACYRNSSNQALCIFPSIMEKIRRPLVLNKEKESQLSQEINEEKRMRLIKEIDEEKKVHSAKETIRVALMELIDHLEKKSSSEIIKNAEENLGVALCFSGLHEEFQPSTLYRQLDAADYLNLVLGDILNLQTMQKEVISATNEAGKVFERSKSTIGTPMIHIDIIPEVKDFQSLLNHVFSTERIKDWKYDSNTKFNECGKITKLSGDPKDVIVLKLQRGQPKEFSFEDVEDLGIPREKEDVENLNNAGGVNNDKFAIPKGKLDFSFAYNKPAGSTMYEVKSFVNLLAETGRNGHYVSYVKKNDQWYYCNDGEVIAIEENVAMEQMQKSYILFLEKGK